MDSGRRSSSRRLVRGRRWRGPISSKRPTDGEAYYHIAEIKMLSSDIRFVEQDVGSHTKS